MGRRKTRIPKAEQRKNIVKLIIQDNRLVEADYIFDIWETRFFYTVVSMIDKSDADNKVYRVWYSDIKRLFKLQKNSEAYKYLREAAESILTKPVKIKYNGEDGLPLQTTFTLFTDVTSIQEGAEDSVEEKRLYIDIGILEKVRPFFLDIKKRFDPKKHRYTAYDIRNIVSLKPYGTRIYELLKQYQKIGERTVLVSRLKRMFNITDEYPRFYDFYKYVIDKSVKDINKHTDLYIPIQKIEKIKKGRSVHAIRFVIQAKSQEEIDVLRGVVKQPSLFDEKTPQIADMAVIEDIAEPQAPTAAAQLYEQFEAIVVKKYGITPLKFTSMLATGKYDAKAIQQAINVTNRAKYNQEIRKTVAGFFMSALKGGYTDAKEEAKKLTQAQQEKQTQLQKIKEKLRHLESEYATKIYARIKQLTAKDPTVTAAAIEKMQQQPAAQALIAQQETTLGRKLEVEDYRETEQLRLLVIDTIVESHPDVFLDTQLAYQPKIEALKQRVRLLGRA